MTPQEVAQQIDILQPNLKEFNESLTDTTSSDAYQLILAEKDINLQLLKAELFLMYFATHQHKYAGNNSEYVAILLCDKFNLTLSNHSNKYYYKANEYDVSNAELKDEFILYHVTNNKQYLPQYLKRKVYPSVSNVELKEPKDDLFSLTAFKSYVASKPKGLSSVEAEGYINKVRKFTNTKDEYITIILDNCKKPSIKLQNQLESTLTNQNTDKAVTKYMYMNKWIIRNLANSLKVPTAYSVFDEQHSMYKPFITNLNRTPTVDDNQFSYLVSALILLKTSNSITPDPVYQHFIEALTLHLEHPDYKEPWQIYIKQLNAQTNAIAELTNHFKE